MEQAAKTFAIHSFGCKVNQEEGRAVAALFLSQGWQELSLQEEAQLYIVNACAVTQVAERKARALLRRLRREQPAALLALCGCYAQVAAARGETFAELDILAGVEERALLPELAAQKLAQPQMGAVSAAAPLGQGQTFTLIAATSEQKRARAYLKIEDGCGEFCNYCIVPYARGPVRSLPQAQAIAQGAELIAQGHKEIVVSGVHIGAYGRDLQDGSSLPGLIAGLTALPGLYRLRLGSIEPQQFTPEILQMLAEEDKICRQLHIPLQSGCDRTLAAMGRKYRTAEYARLLENLRKICPEMAITTDIMVGYPGETEADFGQSQSFCREMGLARMHVFPYSQRPGTPAATAEGQLSREEKKSRAAQMGQTAAQLAQCYGERFIGRELVLLAEQTEQVAGVAYLTGHSDNYLRLLLPAGQAPLCQPGDLLSVTGKRWAGDGLIVALG